MKERMKKKKKSKLSRAQIEQRRAAGKAGTGEPKAEAGAKGGSASTSAKRRAARENAQLGGRPGNPQIRRIMEERGVTRQRAWQIWKAKQK
jgi:hypothetical protein